MIQLETVSLMDEHGANHAVVDAVSPGRRDQISELLTPPQSANTTPVARRSMSFKTPEIKLKECIYHEDKRLATKDVASDTKEFYDLKLHADILDIFRSPLRKFLARLMTWRQPPLGGCKHRSQSDSASQMPFRLLHVYGGEAYRMYWESSVRHDHAAGPPFGVLPPFRRPADIDVMIPLRQSKTWFDAHFHEATRSLVQAFEHIFRLPELVHELSAGATLAAQKGIFGLAGPFIKFRSSPYHYKKDEVTGKSVFDDAKMFHTAIVTMEGYYANHCPTGPITLLEMQLKPERSYFVAADDLAMSVLAPANGATSARMIWPLDDGTRRKLASAPAGRVIVVGSCDDSQRMSGPVLQVLSEMQMLQGAEKVLGNRHACKNSKAKTDVNRFTWFKEIDWAGVVLPSNKMLAEFLPRDMRQYQSHIRPSSHAVQCSSNGCAQSQVRQPLQQVPLNNAAWVTEGSVQNLDGGGGKRRRRRRRRRRKKTASLSGEPPTGSQATELHDEPGEDRVQARWTHTGLGQDGSQTEPSFCSKPPPPPPPPPAACKSIAGKDTGSCRLDESAAVKVGAAVVKAADADTYSGRLDGGSKAFTPGIIFTGGQETAWSRGAPRIVQQKKP